MTLKHKKVQAYEAGDGFFFDFTPLESHVHSSRQSDDSH